MKRHFYLLAFVVFLQSCSMVSTTSCAANKSWSKDEQKQIADFHNSLPKDSIGRGVLEDWERMRRANQ